MLKTGDLVRHSKDERPYSHMGFVDPSYTVPATSEILRVARITHRKNGDIRLTLRNETGGGHGLILNSDWTTKYTWSRIERAA